MSTIPHHVKRLRAKLGWTQKELSAAAGVSRETIARIEVGIYSPRMSTLESLAAALGVKSSHLMRQFTYRKRAQHDDHVTDT